MTARTASAMAGAALLFAVACGLPTDESAQLSLEIVDDIDQLLVGDAIRLTVRVDGAPAGATFDVRFESSDETVLVGDASGLLTAIGEGPVTVTASLVQYEKAGTASIDFFVSRGVVIADVFGEHSTGDRVRFSEVLTILGRRLDPDSLASVSIGGVPAEIVGYDPPDPADPDDMETLRVLVPLAPRQSDLLIVHAGGGSGVRALEVVQEDVFELFRAPVQRTLDAAGFRAAYSTMQWPDYDWFRFTLAPGDWTVDMFLRDGFVLTDRATEYRIELRAPTPTADNGFPAWGREQGGYSCRQPGRFGSLSRLPRREGLSRLTIPIRTSTSMTLDFVASTEQDFIVPYELSVTPGYNSVLAPDDAEGNDFCHRAATLDFGVTRPMTFDTPADHDWFRVSVPGAPTSFATVQRDEIEPNNSRAQADVITSGSRIIGVRLEEGDEDYFAIDLAVGDLLDIDVRSWLLPPNAYGRDFDSEVAPDVRVFDSTGQQVAIGGIAFSVPEEDRTRGTEARIRYVPTVAGRYYIRVVGESFDSFLPDYGDFMYYQLDVWAHEHAGDVTVDASATAGTIDPEIVLIGIRPDGNYPIDRVDTEGGLESMTFPVAPGDYYLLVWNALDSTGSYDITPVFVPR